MTRKQIAGIHGMNENRRREGEREREREREREGGSELIKGLCCRDKAEQPSGLDRVN